MEWSTTITVKKIIRWIILGIIPAFLIGLFFFTIIFLLHPIGPGLPEHMDFSGAVIGNAGHRCDSTDHALQGEQDLCISMRNSGNYPEFPALTPTAGYAIFRQPEKNLTRVVAVWYFENSKDCTVSEELLLENLKNRGQVTNARIDLTHELQSWKYTGRQSPLPILEGTAFESTDTAGYFFIVKNAVMPSRDDCFIEYFGLIDENNLSEGSGDLRKIIALEGNPWYLFTGQTGPLFT